MPSQTIADQLGHSSVALTAGPYLSVAVELGLKSAAAAAPGMRVRCRDRLGGLIQVAASGDTRLAVDRATS
jgi:hypothetical protein